jgi:hypothetical protein
MVDWVHLTSVKDSRNKSDKPTISVRFNVRHPVSWLVAGRNSDKDPHDYWAVAACIQGSSTTPDKNGKSRLYDTRADFVTILPTSRGGSLAIIFLLLTLPFRSGLDALIEFYKDSTYDVRKICIDGKWFKVNPKFPINNEMLEQIAAIRDLLRIGTYLVPEGNCVGDSLCRLKVVTQKLRSTFKNLMEFCSSFYAQTIVRRIGVEKRVKLIDPFRGNAMSTDLHNWILNA